MKEVDRVPQLTAGWKDKADALTPEQGFLLSRIDGQTPWSTLHSIAGLPRAEVDRCLEDWLRDGLIQLSATCGEAESSATQLSVDPSLEVPVEVQRRALEVEALLGGSYHALLGVSRDADARVIKRSYFKLSRRLAES